LAGLALWYIFASATWIKNNGRTAVDTLVSAPNLDWGICLRLDDPPGAKPKKGKSVQPPSDLSKPEIEKPKAINDSAETMPAARTASQIPPAVTASRLPAANFSSATTSGFGGLGGSETGLTGTTVDFFQVGIRAESVVYVIDRSSSMGLRGALELAKRELLVSLEKLPAQTRFQVIVYNRRAECLRIAGRTDLVAASVENKREVAALLQAVRPEGSTDPLPALRQALVLRPEVIFFLSDADDLNVRQVNALTQLNRGHTAIHTIELNTLHRNRDDQPLQMLARNNRGEYRAVPVSAP
jgi:hypothetical protein